MKTFMKILGNFSLRKINSIIVILMILLLLNHVLLSSLYLYGLIDYSPSFQITGRRLFYLFISHLIISLYLYFRDKRYSKGNNKYSHIRNDTIKQMITGVFIVAFAGMHIISYSIYPLISTPVAMKIIHLIIDVLLFVSIYEHLKISLPRLLVSIGFLTDNKSYDKFTDKMNILLSVLLVLLVIAELLFNLA